MTTLTELCRVLAACVFSFGLGAAITAVGCLTDRFAARKEVRRRDRHRT